jgi:CRP/FNR family cyclic AMP-dependent transcriptional regulator
MISPELLRRYPFFAGLGEENLNAIAVIASERDIEKGEVLFREGDAAKNLCVLMEGEVDIAFEGEGDDRFPVDTVVAGHPFCWSSLVEPYEETATAVARGRGRLIEIDGAELRKLCDTDPEVGYLVMRNISKVLRARLKGARVQLIGQA